MDITPICQHPGTQKNLKGGKVEPEEQTEGIQPGTVSTNFLESLIPHPPWISTLLFKSSSHVDSQTLEQGEFESTNSSGRQEISLKSILLLNASVDRKITTCQGT